MFFEIVETSEFKKLLKSGEATEDECHEKWELLVQKHNYFNGNQEYSNYISHLRGYRDLLQRYNTIKSSLSVLLFTIDTPVIQYLKSEGYVIDLTNQEKFERSLELAFNKSDNLNSKIKSKFNQIQNFNDNLQTKREEQNENKTTLEQKLASLSFELGFPVAEDIKLARYNEYIKIINKRNGSGKKRHNNG